MGTAGPEHHGGLEVRVGASVPEQMSQFMPEVRMLEDVPDRMFENMPDRMSDYMWDSMKDVRKCAR